MPLNPAMVKLMILLLGGMVVLSPIADTAKHPKKLPIIAGYKPGKNHLPEGITPSQNYQNAWNLLKKELGLK